MAADLEATLGEGGPGDVEDESFELLEVAGINASGDVEGITSTRARPDPSRLRRP